MWTDLLFCQLPHVRECFPCVVELSTDNNNMCLVTLVTHWGMVTMVHKVTTKLQVSHLTLSIHTYLLTAYSRSPHHSIHGIIHPPSVISN